MSADISAPPTSTRTLIKGPFWDMLTILPAISFLALFALVFRSDFARMISSGLTHAFTRVPTLDGTKTVVRSKFPVEIWATPLSSSDLLDHPVVQDRDPVAKRHRLNLVVRHIDAC